MFIPWTVFLIALIAGAASDDVCTQEKYEGCSYNLQEDDLKQRNGMMFPTAEFWDQHCSPAIESLRCVTDFYRNCPDFPKEAPQSVVDSMFDLMNLICDEDSEVRKGYLQNIECYNENVVQVVICGVSAIAITEDFAEQNENRTEFQDPRLQPCVGIPLITNCIIEEISSACGTEATSPLAEMLHRFSAVAVEVLCPADLHPIWQRELLSYLEEAEQEKRKKKK